MCMYHNNSGNHNKNNDNKKTNKLFNNSCRVMINIVMFNCPILTVTFPTSFKN